MLLNVSHIYKSFGEDKIITDATFTLDDGEKMAIVGNNGTGKSTLLKIIIGQMKADEGEVSFKRDATFGYLAQYQEDYYGTSILDTVLHAREDLLLMEKRLSEMESELNSISNDEMEAFMDGYHKLQNQFDLKGGYTFRSEAVGILKGLGFSEDEFDKGMNELSGGQKTRVSLGRLLASNNDLLLLDEPINHLDLNSIVWLEGFLSSYKGAVIIVAHDRYFLDKIVNNVVDLSYGKTSVYHGNYSAFVKQKEITMLSYERSYEKQQKEIEHQRAVIEKLQSFNREKSIKRAESRKKLLDKMDVMDAPDKESMGMRLTLEIEKESGKDVLEFSNVTKSYGNHNIFTDLSFEVHKGDKIAIIGDNGTGKTTILKCINNLITFEAGEIRFGTNVMVGYYDQEQQGLTETKTIIDELHDSYPYMTETKIRNTLAAFMFTEDDVFKRISKLSGGERGRVSLAKLMLSKSNFLILDEPTNHLDMDSKEKLEDALIKYEGTLLYVSHDRYFINRTANVILELSDGRLTKYLGNYDEYLAKKAIVSSDNNGTSDSNKEAATSSKLDYLEQKKIEANKRRLQNQITKIETEIERLEEEKTAIEKEFLIPENMTNSAKLNELTESQNKIDKQLDKLYEEWEALNNQAATDDAC